MTNTELLKEKVKASGLKYTYLAKRLNLSREGLSKKVNNENEFKASEIAILCTELKITKPAEKEAIFFAV
jgi:transcriptional regulator with XRE-family HTH domain